ncbi:MAG: hypothetical protein ACOX9C_11810 [Kiritimatiellia bacterium]|jgi:hypothetical protein
MTMKNSVSLLTIVTSLGAGITFGGIYDDALIWYRGGCDTNNDGVLQAGEFFDSAHAKSEAAHQTCTLTGTVSYEKGAVWSRHNPLATNEQHYISFKNGDAPDAASCASLLAVNPLAGTTNTYDQYTIHLRFRWDGKFAPGSNDEIVLFNNGHDWSGQRGYVIKLIKTGDNLFKLHFLFGSNGHETGDGATDIPLTPGEWNDWLLLVRNAPPGANASIRFVRCTLPGRIADSWGGWSKSPWISVWQEGGSRTCTIAMLPNSKFQVADKAFSGDVAQWAFWPKRLSELEIREVLSMPCPGDCVFRVGYENGSAKEFAASGATANAVASAHDTWDAVAPQLPYVNDASETVNSTVYRFDVGEKAAGLNQVLRVKAVSGHGWLKAEIRGIAEESWTRLAVRGVNSRVPALFMVPGNLLGKGGHEIRLTYESGAAPIVFDVIELRGSWLMGKLVYNVFYNDKVKYFDCNGVNWTSGYKLLWGYWYGLDTGYPAVEDPLSDAKMLTLKFDVPAEMTGCANTMFFSLNQWAGTPTDLRFYLNGELFKIHAAWQYEVFPVVFPADSFTAGENVLQVRHTGGPSAWWGEMRGLQMQVMSVPELLKPGFSIVLR